MTKTILIISILLLNACGTLPAVVGTSTTTYESYKTITYVKSGIDRGGSIELQMQRAML